MLRASADVVLFLHTDSGSSPNPQSMQLISLFPKGFGQGLFHHPGEVTLPPLLGARFCETGMATGTRLGAAILTNCTLLG